jgi:uncharacterized membrane protein
VAEVPSRVEGSEMKRDSSFCLACFLGLIFLTLSSMFVANAAPANNKAKPKADVTEKKISFDIGKKDAKGKSIRREFPTMFNIADRSKKHKDKKVGKK